MAEPTARIESPHAFREPDGGAATSKRDKEKPPRKLRLAPIDPELAAPDDLEEDEKHQLDTRV